MLGLKSCFIGQILFLLPGVVSLSQALVIGLCVCGKYCTIELQAQVCPSHIPLLRQESYHVTYRSAHPSFQVLGLQAHTITAITSLLLALSYSRWCVTVRSAATSVGKISFFGGVVVVQEHHSVQVLAVWMLLKFTLVNILSLVLYTGGLVYLALSLMPTCIGSKARKGVSSGGSPVTAGLSWQEVRACCSSPSSYQPIFFFFFS